MPWTPEEAREHARKGGQARQEKRREEAKAAKQPPADEALMQQLWEASQGLGDWKTLKPSERLDALKRYMEYRLGKPSAKADKEEPSPGEQEKHGIVLD